MPFGIHFGRGESDAQEAAEFKSAATLRMEQAAASETPLKPESEKADKIIEYHPSPESVQNFRSMQYKVTMREAGERIPEQIDTLEKTLREVDRQFITEYSGYKSTAFPGVEFTFSKLTITPEVLSRIFQASDKNTIETAPSNDDSDSENQDIALARDSKKQTFFLYGALNDPPGGDASGMYDMAYDRYIREMPHIAEALARGQQPPAIDIYMVGTPTGMGGQVTPEWNQALKEDYLGAHSKLYKEFITDHLEEQADDGRAVALQGASKGALIAAQTAADLPPELQTGLQVRMDSPAGDHAKYDNPLLRGAKAAQVAVGLGGEGAVSAIVNQETKDFLRLKKESFQEMADILGIQPDSDEQAALKNEAAGIERKALFFGVDPDIENTRTFVVRGIRDPLTRGPIDYFTQKFRERAKQGTMGSVIQNSGHQTRASVDGAHFYTPNNHYERWGVLLGREQRVFDSLPRQSVPETAPEALDQEDSHQPPVEVYNGPAGPESTEAA